jgi:hypothetical protein
MSAASPAQNQVPRAAAATQEQASTRVYDFSQPRGEDEIRVNLADVPVMRTTIDADVFEPTLLSRLFDLFGPRR